MSRLYSRVLALAAATLLAVPIPALADTSPVPPGTPNANIFDPQHAPMIVIHIEVHRLVLVPRASGSSTTLSAQAIENKPNNTSLNSIIASSVAGAAAAPSGELHIRGSHGQYSYYLDGAPLPSNVSGSFSDLISPKNIEMLRVYTGGFPAQYGGQLAAIFDVTAKTGQVGKPGGFLQQMAQGYSAYQTSAQFGGASRDFSYFLSGIRSSTHIRLSPLTQTPLHDAGLETVGFGKFDLQSGPSDRLTLDTGGNGAAIQVPNEESRQEVGQNDIQKENGAFGNLIWSHVSGPNTLRVALYAHNSQLRYDGSPQDLTPDHGSTDTSQLATTFENEKAAYVGLRTDYAIQAGRHHNVQIGLDVDRVTGSQFFNSYGAPQPNPADDQPTILDNRSFSGGDRNVYAQDDWTAGRLLADYGLRYDRHQADITTSQLSPRLNLTYTMSRRDKVHAYYDRLFQPVAIEDVKKLQGTGTAPFQPERDDFYEVGWEHQNAGTTLSLDGYYRVEKNTIDDQVFGNTQIVIPINFAKGYTRGLEIALDGPLTKTLSYFANYARSWAQGAGPITGGLLGESPTSYFYDDHDQTHTASLGLDYENRGNYATLDGEYGSGFPYGEIDKTDAQGNPVLDPLGNPYPVALNFQRVPAHFIFNFGIGTKIGNGQVAMTVDNLLNHGYVIKEAGPFTDTEWGQGRTYGLKWTQDFN